MHKYWMAIVAMVSIFSGCKKAPQPSQEQRLRAMLAPVGAWVGEIQWQNSPEARAIAGYQAQGLPAPAYLSVTRAEIYRQAAWHPHAASETGSLRERARWYLTSADFIVLSETSALERQIEPWRERQRLGQRTPPEVGAILDRIATLEKIEGKIDQIGAKI